MAKSALDRINTIAAELRTRRKIAEKYHANLKSRFIILWGKPKCASESNRLAVSREKRAREIYQEVQNENCHMLFPFMLAVGPRICIVFNKIDQIAQLKTFRLNLTPRCKTLCDGIAVKNGFDKNPLYICVMQSLFPADFLEAPPKCNARPESGAVVAISKGCSKPTPTNETQRGSSAVSETPPNRPNFGTDKQHLVLENASLHGIGSVFDEYMSDAIRSDIDQSGGVVCLKAAVTMDFPFQGLVDCLMSLAIHESKVEYLAMALFKVRVESVGGVQHVVLNEGVRLTPNPEITLKGALDESIIRVFGREIHGAITASRMRKKELEEGNHITECVSMILTSNSSQGAIVNLSLDLKGGAQISNKIYL